MNLVFVSLDSLNRHFLTTYGNDWVRTPNIADFARRACVFEQHYAGSMPCMPARREVWTGTQEMWWRWWGPLEPWDLTLPYLLRQARVTNSMLVTDHYHFFEWGGHGYEADFSGYQFIRGQESDNWRTDPPRDVPDWARVMVQRSRHDWVYLRNAQDFRTEEDFFSPRVFTAAAEWIDRNAGQRPFYLHVDAFDPHEPFHVPEPYRSMYTDDDYRKYSPWPAYGRVDADGPSALGPQEIAWVRAQYAGKLTMADKWFGRLLDALDRHHLWDDTAVILTTDHGHYLGEHGWMGKPPAPLYRTLSHIPLMIWHPGGACGGRQTSAITQTVDLFATAMDIMGVPVPERPNIHSRSLMPVVSGRTERHRDFAFYGYCNARAGVTDAHWALTRNHDASAAPPAAYSLTALMGRFGHNVRTQPGRRMAQADLTPARIPGVDVPVWRTVLPERHNPDGQQYLWDVVNDPDQKENVAAECPDQVSRLVDALREYLTAIGAPQEQFARLRL